MANRQKPEDKRLSARLQVLTSEPTKHALALQAVAQGKSMSDITREALETAAIPRVKIEGYIFCGYGEEVRPLDDMTATVPEHIEKRNGDYALLAVGSSMKVANGETISIEDGACCLFRPDVEANGKIAHVEYLHNGQTCCTAKKVFKQKDGKTRLKPLNPEYQELILDRVKIKGVYVASWKD